MKLKIMAAGAILASALATSALAQTDTGPNSNWQFQSANEKAVAQGNVVLMQQKQNDYYKFFKNGAAGAFGGSGGIGAGVGASTSTVGNIVQVINSTENNCTSSAAGAITSCGGGANTNSSGQTNTGNTMTGTTTTTTGDITNKDNQSSVVGQQTGGVNTPFAPH